jgi:hypothetical protein
MEKGNVLKKALAVAGAVLVLLPIACTVATSIAGSISAGRFLFDYLMPAELFFLVFAGALLLLGASLWTRLFRPHIVAGVCCAVVLFFGMQLMAEATGLASGETAPGGWAWYAVLAALVLYIAAVVEMGIVGIVLSKRLFAAKQAE